MNNKKFRVIVIIAALVIVAIVTCNKQEQIAREDQKRILNHSEITHATLGDTTKTDTSEYTSNGD